MSSLSPPGNPASTRSAPLSCHQTAAYGIASPTEAPRRADEWLVAEGPLAIGRRPQDRTPVHRSDASWQEALVVTVLSALLAALLFHRAWGQPFSSQAGVNGDADEYAWFLSWVPYAIGHGLNPLGSTFVNFPHGVNLMWNTSVLLPSFLLSPFTVVLGAAFSYNLLATGALALSSSFAYIAFRRWTGRLPALVGALIFGFSPYMVSQSVGHLAQTLMVSAPLFLIVFDRLLVVQRSKPWVDGLLLGALAWAQLLTGEEVLAMEAVVAVVAIVVVCALNHGAVLSHFGYAIKGAAVGTAVFACLSVPFLAYQYLGPDKVQDVHPANTYVSDIWNFIVPTNITRFAPNVALHVSSQFTGNGSEDNAYIGIPLLLFIVFTLFIARRRGVTWAAFAIAASAALLSMGETLHDKGNITTQVLPDSWLQALPFYHNLLPDRFASVMFLGVGLLVTVGLDELRRFKTAVQVPAWSLTALGLVAIFPITTFPAGASPRYSAFQSGLACPAPAPGAPASSHPVALVLPSINEMALRWQAESQYCFIMPSDTGMTGTNGGDVGQLRLMVSLGQPGTKLPALTPAVRTQAAGDIKGLHIKEIIVAPAYPYSAVVPWSANDQRQLVAWIEGLLGQAPLTSHDPSVTYVWKNLPPIGDIASGHVAYVKGAL